MMKVQKLEHSLKNQFQINHVNQIISFWIPTALFFKNYLIAVHVLLIKVELYHAYKNVSSFSVVEIYFARFISINY